MKMTRILNPKTAAVSFTSLALAFIGGMALVSHPAAQPVHTFKSAADTTTVQLATDPSSQTTTQTVPTTTTTDPNTSSSPTSTPSGTTTATDTSTTTTTSQSDPSAPAAPAVVAVSAELSDWSAPEPSTDPNQLPGTTFQTRYCRYTYSDGSTQQTLYQTTYTHDHVVAYTDPTFDCAVATAPAAN